ncbi:MAG: AI-2E family transporter [Agathobacter sp.]|nr:AI-2E family transporter [Agathobacter sp.]
MKKMLGLAGALVIVYLVIRYWAKLEGIITLAFSAASPLIIGCVMAYVINILMGFYEKWYDKLFQVEVARKAKRIVCLILAFLSLIGIVSLIINLVLPELINCIASFIRLIPGALQMMIDFVGEEQILKLYPQLSEGFDITTISSEIEGVIKTIAGGVGGAVESIMAVVSSAASVVVNVVIGLIFSLYVLLDKENLGEQTKCLVKTYLPKVADKVFYVTKVVDDSFHSFIVGQCIEAVVLGGLCIVGMLIFQFPYAVMIGVFIGFTALIPIAGAYIGAGVGAVMILTVSPIQAIQFLIFVVVLQQLEGNLIYPKVVGKSIGLPGIWVLTAITIGGGVLGVGGMLLAVPLFAAGYRLLKEDVQRRNPVIVSAEEAADKLEKIKEEMENEEESIFENEDAEE